MDKANSGFISANDLPTTDPEIRRKLMSVADVNKDGKISKVEYFKVMMPSVFVTKYMKDKKV